MTGIAQIHVRLPDEAIDVWRPVTAEPLGGNVYRILVQPYDREIEKWQFEPGESVCCGLIQSGEGHILAATKRAPEGDAKKQ